LISNLLKCSQISNQDFNSSLVAFIIGMTTYGEGWWSYSIWRPRSIEQVIESMSQETFPITRWRKGGYSPVSQIWVVLSQALFINYLNPSIKIKCQLFNLHFQHQKWHNQRNNHIDSLSLKKKDLIHLVESLLSIFAITVSLQVKLVLEKDVLVFKVLLHAFSLLKGLLLLVLVQSYVV